MSSRRHRLVALALAVALAAAACSDDPGDAAEFAARAGGAEISKADFEAEVEQLLDNEGFREQLVLQGVEPGEDGPAPNFVATWLSRLIFQLAADGEFARQGLEVTDEQRDEARDYLEQLFGGADVFGDLSATLRRELVERTARNLALGEAAIPTAPEPSDAAVESYYENVYARECESGRRVAHVLVETRADAEGVLDELADGTPFAEVAAERSTDTATASAGGDLGCLVAGAFVPEFESAATDAPFGEPVGPVETQFGFHVIVATRHEEKSLDEAREEIFDLLRAEAEGNLARLRAQNVDQLLRQLLDDVGVEVAPEYGTWVVDERGGRVVPRPGPGVTTSVAPDTHDDE
jgi:parvulin-like peptidyl-prolyl isomerase